VKMQSSSEQMRRHCAATDMLRSESALKPQQIRENAAIIAGFVSPPTNPFPTLPKCGSIG